MLVLRLFFIGALTEEETIKRLLPQKLKDQYVFKTEASLATISYQGASLA